MSKVANPTYRISWRSPLVVTASVLLAVSVALTWPWGLLPLAMSLGVLIVIILLVPAVTVRPDGISLYGVNHLHWDDVASVRATSIFGLPYAVVRRHRGMRWWIPLYVDDRRGLLATLASRAPAGSEFHVFAAAGSN